MVAKAGPGARRAFAEATVSFAAPDDEPRCDRHRRAAGRGARPPERLVVERRIERAILAPPGRDRRGPTRDLSAAIVGTFGADRPSHMLIRVPVTGALTRSLPALQVPGPAVRPTRAEGPALNVGQNYPYTSETEAERVPHRCLAARQAETLAAETTALDVNARWCLKCPTAGCPGSMRLATPGTPTPLRRVRRTCARRSPLSRPTARRSPAVRRRRRRTWSGSSSRPPGSGRVYGGRGGGLLPDRGER